MRAGERREVARAAGRERRQGKGRAGKFFVGGSWVGRGGVGVIIRTQGYSVIN